MGLQSPIELTTPVDWQHPLSRGLVAWWLVLPGIRGGTWVDITKHGHDGTLSNMDPATDWVGAKELGSFGALDFDGSNDRVIVPDDSDLDGFSEVTYSARVTFAALAADQGLISKYSGANGNMLWFDWFGVSGNDVFSFFWRASGFDRIESTGITLVVGREYHVVAVHDGSNGLLYIDGKLNNSKSTSVAASAVNTKDVWLGATDDGGNRRLTGRLDDCKIYKRALSALEVQRSFELSQLGYPGLLRRISRPRFFSVDVPEVTIINYGIPIFNSSVFNREYQRIFN